MITHSSFHWMFWLGYAAADPPPPPPHTHSLNGEELGLGEMPDSYNSDSNQSGGPNISDESRGEGVCDDSDELFSPKRLRKSCEPAPWEGGELTSQPKKHLITALQ